MRLRAASLKASSREGDVRPLTTTKPSWPIGDTACIAQTLARSSQLKPLPPSLLVHGHDRSRRSSQRTLDQCEGVESHDASITDR
jgi:hypothetical protein